MVETMSDALEDGAPLDALFPPGSRVLLTGTGKQFLERVGVETARQIVLGVLQGENIRSQTEPLTRQRVTQVGGALISLFLNGWLAYPDFTERLSAFGVQQLAQAKGDPASTWLAQWVLGLTGKAAQNVLGGRTDGRLTAYVSDFEQAVTRAANSCQADIGQIRMTLGYVEDASGRQAELAWRDILRLITAIGSQTLTIRGSDKSLYGKLFERLVLGSLLSILGFQQVSADDNSHREAIFWLSDSKGLRESDATLLLRPGKVARFDVGFIGPGNSEISKDKLSRYARQVEAAGQIHSSVTFVVVDRLPPTSKTKQLANNIGAEIIQMSFQYWPRQVALRLGERLGFEHPIQKMADEQVSVFLKRAISTVPLQEYVSGLSVRQLETEIAANDSDEPGP